MFLNLGHINLDVFKVSKALVLACYRQTLLFPSDERFGMSSQIRRAALSVHLNLVEGCSRKSFAERKRFFEISRGSLIEVDSAYDIAIELNYTSLSKLQDLGSLIIRYFQLISKMINK
jgi:four helix bundle protein